jgi:hypothetical protein
MLLRRFISSLKSIRTANDAPSTIGVSATFQFASLCRAIKSSKFGE